MFYENINLNCPSALVISIFNFYRFTTCTSIWSTILLLVWVHVHVTCRKTKNNRNTNWVKPYDTNHSYFWNQEKCEHNAEWRSINTKEPNSNVLLKEFCRDLFFGLLCEISRNNKNKFLWCYKSIRIFMLTEYPKKNKCWIYFTIIKNAYFILKIIQITNLNFYSHSPSLCLSHQYIKIMGNSPETKKEKF